MAFFLPHSDFIFQPTCGDPVKESRFILSSSTSFCHTTLSLGTTEKAPFGRGDFSIISANISILRGVADAGLMIIGQPAAMAGAIL